MTEKRADELVKGDVLQLRGDRWTVVKAKVKGKHVRLTIDGRRGSFTDEVKARTVYDVVTFRDGEVLGGETSGRRGAATPKTRPDASPSVSVDLPWADVVGPADAVVVDQLGARLVGVEVEGGRLVVPPVDDSTLFGHLLTMHGRRFDGATVSEARAWAKANPGRGESMEQVLDSLSIQKAYALHDGLHVDLTAMEHPHWHRERMPA